MQNEDEELSVITLEENLSDIEKPPEIPAGRYVGEVQGVEIKVSQGRGNRYFAIKFIVPTDQLPSDFAEHYEDGAVFFWNRNLVPNGKDRRALYNMRKLIEAFGLPSNTSSVDPNDWMGCRARLNIVHDRYQGETRAQIKSIEPAETVTARTPTARGGKRK